MVIWTITRYSKLSYLVYYRVVWHWSLTKRTDLCKHSTSQSKAIAPFFKDRVNLFEIGGHLTIYMINIEDIMIKISAKWNFSLS